MAQKSWHLNRRGLLKGAGVALALPYLSAMEGVAKAATSVAGKQAPKRFLAAVALGLRPCFALRR